MQKIASRNRWVPGGFTLVELLISITLSILIASILGELFLSNQRSLKMQLALSELTTRSQRVSAIFRYAIHHAQADIEILNGNQLRAGSSLFIVEKSRLAVVEGGHRKTTLVEGVGDMKIAILNGGVGISIVVTSGSLRRVIYVFTALR